MTSGDESPEFLSCPIPLSDYANVVIGHGSGGKLSHQLLQKLIVPQFQNEYLKAQHDGAVLPVHGGRIAFATDSYVVDPLFFPGGDIGALAVNGTINDLAMCGAKPLFLSASFIIEEGCPIDTLWRVIRSMRQSACAAGVEIVTGDTKVVERGKADKLFVNTSGIGVVPEGIHIHPQRVAIGDSIILSGPIGSHGIAVMSAREELEFETHVESDSAALHTLVASVLAAAPDVHVLRDPTRGGIASALNEIASQALVGLMIREASIPIQEEVAGACEILGLDPLYVANEGKLIAIVPASQTGEALMAMRSHELGREAVVIGEVVHDHPGFVTMRTRVGGTRVVDMLSGEQLPRIC